MASLTRGGLFRDERGVSDVLAMAFMFLIAIFAGVLLHAYGSGAIASATDRQLQMKAEYLYRTLELAQVENYSLSYFEAITENFIKEENLMRSEPVVPGDYLQEQIDNLLTYLRPPGYAVEVKFTRENSSRVRLYPRGVEGPDNTTTQFTFSGKVTIIIAEAENRVAQVDAKVVLFKP